MAKTKIPVTLPILNYEGQPVKEGATPITHDLINKIREFQIPWNALADMLQAELNKPDLTYRTAIHTALNTFSQDEKPTSTDKAKAFEITSKTFATNEPEYTDDQVAFIIDRVEKVFIAPIIVGRIKECFTVNKSE